MQEISHKSLQLLKKFNIALLTKINAMRKDFSIKSVFSRVNVASIPLWLVTETFEIDLPAIRVLASIQELELKERILT